MLDLSTVILYSLEIMQENTSISDSLNPNGGAKNALKDFQLSGNSKDKTREDFGKKIILQVEQILNSGYFNERNKRFELNRAMYNGRMDIKKFMDFFNMNGKTNYVNINWKSIMIVNTIVNRLVGRWMTKKPKASVTATDPISIDQKKEAYDNAEFYMHNQGMLQQLGAEAGASFIPQDQFIPDDKDHLDLWMEEELRIPEEILMEKGINQVFDENGWGDMGVNTRKHKIDAAVVGLIGKETIADKNGRIIDKYCKPENMFYSYSERDDFKDASIKGVVESYKISEIRDQYPNLEVKKLYEIAKISKQWNVGGKLSYDNNWHTGMYLPFDDWNVDVVRFTLESLDTDGYEMKVSKAGKLFVDKKAKKPDNDSEYVEKDIWNIYRGVYVRTPEIIILEWGLEKNMIKPQEYEKISQAQSPYSFYMYQNSGMRNLAVPEKIEEPVEMMILTRLKIQQFIALMTPIGFTYDIAGLQDMDLGNGTCSPLELRRVTSQTGDRYYRSKDAEGNKINPPITENANSAGFSQLQGLIETYNYHLQVLRDEIGINEFAEGQTIKPRTGVENVQTSMEISFNATDYMNDATVACMDESADKVACLLHDSVEFGSKEYRSLMGEQDVKGRGFKTKIEMLPTEEAITALDNTINQAIAANPVLVLYLNPEKIKRIARKNVKLGEQYFRQGQRRAIEGEAKKAQQLSEQNAKVQQDAGIAVEKEKQNTLSMEMDVKTGIEGASSQARKEESLINMIAGIYQKGLEVPEQWKAVEMEIINNLALPLFAKNKQTAQAIQEQEQPQQEEGMEQGAEQGMEQMPQEQIEQNV